MMSCRHLHCPNCTWIHQRKVDVEWCFVSFTVCICVTGTSLASCIDAVTRLADALGAISFRTTTGGLSTHWTKNSLLVNVLHAMNAVAANFVPRVDFGCDCSGCHGVSLCCHKKVRRFCKRCVGVEICAHNKIQNACKLCGGSA